MEQRMHIKDLTVLITGGTGSFGRAFATRLLKEHSPHKVIIFSRDEWKQWEMRRSDPVFNHPAIRYFLGDVRDRDRLRRAFHEVDIVIHAAALKQVATAEYNPAEFVKTNVEGTMNVIDAAIDCGVKKVIALSTDKAVNPVNLYGATKLCADKLLIAGNSYVGTRKYPQFSVVRYGNVLGSRGSVISLWRKMAQEGATSLPVTDMRMTRFAITLDQAVQFVIERLAHMQGEEIFIPKSPSMKIVDLADAVCPGIAKEPVGIQEGEKLHELLICPEDTPYTFEFDTHYVLMPRSLRKEWHSSYMLAAGGKHVPENFSYASHTNPDWLQAEQLRHVLANV
jgi:UDP-N-acetylglucosamine 4,6-dehydratase/5-epimerase